MKKTIIFSALALLLPMAAIADPSIRLLGFSTVVPDNPKIKAVVDLDGHSIKQVEAISYNVADGSHTSVTDQYRIYEGKYISSDFNMSTTSMFHRLRVTLDDDTVLLTECANHNNTEAFMWVTDFPWTSHTCAVDPAIDVCINGEQLNLSGTPYYKGISSRGGTVTYNFPAEYNFTKASTRIAVQNGTSGSLQFRLRINGGSELGFTRSIGSYYDINSTDWSAYVPSLPITSLVFNFSQNPNATANFLIPRLYMTRTSNRAAQTVNFTTRGGTIDYPRTVTVEATASSGGTVYYEVLAGAEAISIDGHKVTFLDGHNTRVVILATQYGNDEYEMAMSTLTFDVQTGGKIFFSSFLGANGNAQNTGFISINPAGKTLEQLFVTIYDNVNTLNQVAQIDLLPLWNELPGTAEGRFIPFDGSLATGNSVLRIGWQFEGEAVSYGPYRLPDGTSFDYMSDLPYTRNLGYGGLQVNLAYSGARLNLNGTQYAKGFGIHGNANNWVQTNFDLSNYERFIANVGKQNGQPYKMAFALYDSGTLVTNTGDIAANSPRSWNYEIPEGSSYLRISALNGSDGTGNDHGSICAPRFIRRPAERREQVLTWVDTQELVNDRPFTYDLTRGCNISSGKRIFYRVVSGNEYAEITGETTLSVTSIPQSAEIVVEAYQPGNREWVPSNVATCIFRFNQGKIVNLDEEITLPGGTELDELIVYTDGTRAGSVQVTSGIVNVNHLKLRYIFTPGRWHSICFPTSVDIDRISNLAEKGYDLNDGYYLRAFNSQASSNYPDQNPWHAVTSSRLDRNRGYMIMLDEANGTSPVEIEFHIDNVNLDSESTLHVLNLTLDLSEVYAGTEHAVYLKPANVKGNTLKVIVDYNPEDPLSAPVNHEKALQEARITYAPMHTGIRLVLPDAQPAKVAIFDGKGKVVKAVRYIAPNLIDLSDLPSGEYTVAVQYGPATATLPLKW